MTTSATRPLWAEATEWADELTDPIFVTGRDWWDHRAASGITAITAYALAVRHQLDSVRAVGLDRLIVPLFDLTDLTALITDVLTASGHLPLPDTPSTSAQADPVTAMWAWLTRPWPVDDHGLAVAEHGVEPPPRHSIGGRCAPRPSIDVYRGWARAGVDTALLHARGGIPTRTHVTITGGDWAGRHGRVETPAWRVHHDRVAPGPPGAYMINLGRTPDTDESIAAQAVVRHLNGEAETADELVDAHVGSRGIQGLWDVGTAALRLLSAELRDQRADEQSDRT